MPGMNPRMMKQAMKKMGMTQQEVEATEVIIRTAEKEIVITTPQVTKVNMMGQDTYQIVGEEHERLLDVTPEISVEDVQTVMDTSLEKDDHIKFQAGTHDKAISMSMDEYRELVKPKVLEFSYHVMS